MYRFSNQNKLENAIALAALWHKDQRDKGGEPYILHLLRVMGGLSLEVDRIVAVFHDCIEDAPNHEVREERKVIIRTVFGTEVLSAVLALSRLPGEDYILAYMPRLLQNEIACRVKPKDLLDNLDFRRLPKITPKDLLRHGKYARAMSMIPRPRKPLFERTDDLPEGAWQPVTRASGEVECGICGRQYNDHYMPIERTCPSTVIACSGCWLKL